jgi:hypothetical protein
LFVPFEHFIVHFPFSVSCSDIIHVIFEHLFGPVSQLLVLFTDRNLAKNKRNTHQR